MSTPTAFHGVENLAPADRLLFSKYGRGPIIPPAFSVVHHAFEHIVDNHPNQTAIRHHDGSSVTYGQLEARANSLANLLISRGLTRGERVCCVWSRGIYMVTAIMAILKAGGQYVPLDGNVASEEYLQHIFGDTRASFVVCLEKHKEKVLRNLPGHGMTVYSLDGPNSEAELYGGNTTRPDVRSQPRDGAYAIYTSGTTGKPKGVDVRHENVCNMLMVEPARLGITIGTNVSQVLSVSFDMGQWENLVTMMHGGTLHPRGRDWVDCLSRVDVAVTTPSVLAKFKPAQFPNLKTVVVGGEPCPVPLAELWSPHVKFINICGPTEITILNTAHIHKPGGKLSIGKPLPNSTLYILDENENPIAIGETGIMWCGGMGVSRGYLNLPELSATRFKYDKFTRDGKMMFNTGDLGRWLPDGSIEHLGRRDDQVKIKGFRVELDGIATAIERFPTIEKACALLVGETLWGFYASPAPVNQEQLEKSVGVEVPYYAIPGKWQHMISLPVTPNGKIDKRGLKNFAETGTPPPAESAPPAPTPAAANAPRIVETNAKGIDMEKGRGNIIQEKAVSATSDDNIDDDEKYMLPPKLGFHGGRWLRYRIFSLYRRCFSLIFLGNAIAFLSILDQARRNMRHVPIPSVGLAVSCNLCVAILIRQEHVINLLFWAFSRLPNTAPMWMRRLSARIYHLGGVHSGCAVSASTWWIIYTAACTVSFANPGPKNPYPIDIATLVLNYLILTCLLAMLTMAYPHVREKVHDSFEWTHRWAGWTALALFWAQNLVATNSLRGNTPYGDAVVRSPGFWINCIVTFSTILPWLSLRKVKCVPEPLSKHCVRLYFDFTHTIAGKFIRIADHPLKEWHAFAAVGNPNGRGFSCVISNAGDWTRATIENPPTQVWVKGVPTSGVLAVAIMFKGIVLVGTGSGIGPCLPVMFEGKVPCRVLWSTPHPLETFGQGIVDAVLKADPNAIIWNTRTQGKPDLAQLAYQLYRESNCDAVAIISNKRVTQQFVYRMESRGVPAFGAIFDS